MVRCQFYAAPSGEEMESISLDDLDEVDLLLTELEISRGRGNLIICSVASPAYRDKVIAAVEARFPCRVKAVETGDKLISDLRNAKEGKEEILIWKLPERLSPDILDALNNFRELFYDAGVPSLVFITPVGVDDIIWKAPDFWRYRGGYHILKGEERGIGFQAVSALSTTLDFSYKNKEDLLRRERINEHLLEKMQNKKAKLNILNELGRIHFLLSEQRKAIEFFEQTLKILREIGDRGLEGAALGNLGSAYLSLGEYRKAIKIYEQALKILREIGDLRGEGTTLGNLGFAHSNLGEYHKAIEFYEQALKILREIGDRGGEGAYLNNLGIAYSNLGETRKAVEFFEQDLKISREIGDLRGEGSALGNLGIAYSNLGEPHKAIELYEQALKILREIGNREGEGAALGNLGIAYYHLGEPRKAIEFYEQQLDTVRKIEDRKGEGGALWNTSLALDELGNRAKAIKFARAALKIYEDIEDPTVEKVRRKLQEWDSI